MKIEELITAMLKENTGSHFLDSGGAYGQLAEKPEGGFRGKSARNG